MRIFLDTNILIDVVMERAPFFESAASIWTMAEENRHEAYVAAISFNNIYYIFRKAQGRRDAELIVRTILKVFRVVAVDRQMLDRALQVDFDDFEDAIQYQCALKCKATHLITRNTGHFPGGPLKIMTSEQFLRQ